MVMIACIVIMSITFFFVFYAMIGYPVFLLIAFKIKKPPKLDKLSDYEPTVSYMIVAHNEEKVIEKKLKNALEIDYPKEKLQIIVASDFCTDSTDEIVEKFIKENNDYNIVLYKAKEHKGKTNAQNEAQKVATGEILVMTDANALFDSKAIRELVSSFTNKKIVYVCGKLVYTNEDNDTSATESSYWNLDMKLRDIESRLQTITAGNGSIYAVRNSEYIDVKPIDCHDSAMPYIYSLENKKAVFNPDAISYEKAGETNTDEFKRKVRMNRTILNIFIDCWKPMNIFKYKWFSVFYFGHRTCRYLIWLNHLIFFITSVVFTAIGYYIAGGILVGLQILALLIGLISKNYNFKFKPFRILGYYVMTVLAQLVGAVRQLSGKSKPTWEKAESTR